MRKTGLIIAGFDDGRGEDQGMGQPSKVGEVKKTDSFLDPPGKNTALPIP